jgi:hypothetical protein
VADCPIQLSAAPATAQVAGAAGVSDRVSAPSTTRVGPSDSRLAPSNRESLQGPLDWRRRGDGAAWQRVLTYQLPEDPDHRFHSSLAPPSNHKMEAP